MTLVESRFSPTLERTGRGESPVSMLVGGEARAPSMVAVHSRSSVQHGGSWPRGHEGSIIHEVWSWVGCSKNRHAAGAAPSTDSARYSIQHRGTGVAAKGPNVVAWMGKRMAVLASYFSDAQNPFRHQDGGHVLGARVRGN